MVGAPSRQILPAVSLALLLALAGCGPRDQDRPVDGGLPLELDFAGTESEKWVAQDPCWRREGRGWHLSVGHCEEMLPPQRISGVWVTGFEESSFFPGATALPDPNDPRRFRISLEVDSGRVGELTGREAEPSEYHAIAITFVGRRTKYPLHIDCYGGRDYAFVADRVERARYLGTMADPDPPPSPSERAPYEPFRRSGEGGVVSRMEEQALARCAPGRPDPPT